MKVWHVLLALAFMLAASVAGAIFLVNWILLDVLRANGVKGL